MLDEDEITARQMRRLLDARDDRAAVLSRFVGTLSADDERLLADLLRRTEQAGDRGRRPVSIAVLVTMAVSLLFAATAPALGRRLPPTLATRVLVAGSLAVTASTLFVLAVVAFTWVGQLPEIAALGPWSTATLRQRRSDPRPRRHRGHAAAAAARRPGELDWSSGAAARCSPCSAAAGTYPTPTRWSSSTPTDADAFTTPQRRGRIVVTTGPVACPRPRRAPGRAGP